MVSNLQLLVCREMIGDDNVKRHSLPVLCVVAAQAKTGKTTFMEQVIAELTRRGYRVGAVKSHCGDFAIDIPGKDSWRFTQAGAQATAIVGPQQYALLQRTAAKAELADVVSLLQHVDIVLAEGFTYSGYPQIEIVRQARSEQRLTVSTQVIAVATDMVMLAADVPVLSLTDYSAAADFIITTFLADKQQDYDGNL